MYQGKHASTTKMSKKTLILLAALLLIFTMTAGSTLAYLITSTPSVENTFLPTSLNGSIDEDFDNTTKSNVTVTNSSQDVDAYIRATAVITWKNASGEVYGMAPKENTHYEINYGSDWLPGDDGFYYYKNKVAKRATTNPFVVTCTVLAAAPEEGYKLSVDIITQGIQAEPPKAVTESWGVTVNTDGTITP